MKILIVTSRLPSNGQSLDMAPLARQIESLKSAGAEVEVLEVKGAKGEKGRKYLRAVPRLRKLARGADIIHGHYAYCGWLARTVWWKPVVCSFMGDDLLGSPDSQGHIGLKSKIIIKGSQRLARMVDAVIVKSPEMAEIIAPVKAHVVPNGVDMDTFTSYEQEIAREKLGWNPKTRTILFPSNPDNPRKGFDLASAALDLARQRSGEELEMAILWRVPPEQVPIYMNACDAMFMTSWLEGSPNVVKEAMSCNLPVVSVPVGDVEHLLYGVDGYSVCPRDPAIIADALLETLARTVPVDGRGALKRQKLDTSSVAHRLLDIYSSVLSQKKVNASPIITETR